jgi:hypothetical protein
MPKPRALGNHQKDLRDQSIMKQADILRTIRESIKERRDPYTVLTEIALNAHDTIDLLKRMEAENEHQL